MMKQETRATKQMTNAIKYLYGTPIDKEPLMASLAILRLARAGARRGWLSLGEIKKLTKLTVEKSIKKHATASEGL
jgi:hypothetical protein